MASGIRVDVLTEKLEAELKAMQAKAQDATPAFSTIGRVLSNRIRMGFATSRNPWGAPWLPLKTRLGQPLRNTGLLARSITSKPGKDFVEVGTNRVGARTHQFGAIIKPVKAKGLRFKIGDRYVFAKQVTIPARPFMPLNRAGNLDLPAAWAKGMLQALAKHLGVGVPA